MNEREFARFSERSVCEYAQDLMRAGDLSNEKAREQAGQEFRQMLPDGAAIANQRLMTIVDARTGKPVGFIWYFYEMNDGAQQVFLSDLLIFEDRRRKGYAAAALGEMEQDAKRDGCGESVAYVWEHNLPGLKLYQKCGYAAFRSADDGVYLKKKLM